MGFKTKSITIIATFKLILFTIIYASTAYAELKLDSVYPTLGELGKDLEVTLKGSGFDGNTRASMYLDSGNKRAILGSVDTPNEATQVAVAGNKAYVTGGTSLQVIDVSNPASPQIIGSVDTPGNAFGVAVVGTTAYVVDDIYFMDTGLKIVDVSDPTSPRIIGSADTPGYAWGIEVVGTTAYVADGVSGLQVIDVSNPTNPHIIGSVVTPGNAKAVAIVGTTVYVIDDYGLQVIDVSNPTSPQIIGSLVTPAYACGVAAVGTTAYVTIGSGLQVIDASNPASPQIISSVVTPGYACGVTVVGTTAYVADSTYGLQMINVSNPSDPQVIGSVDTPKSANGVAVDGTTAYVADLGGLQVIDVSTPAELQMISIVHMPRPVWDVAVVGTTAFVANSDSGLQVVDVGNPASPQIISSVVTPGYAYGVVAVGSTAYVADGSSLQVIDVSTPANPQIIGSVVTPGYARRVAVVGTKAYVVDDEYGHTNPGFKVIDISNPTNPQVIGSVDTPGTASDVAVVGTTAYVADAGVSSGLQVIDVSNPTSPQIIGSLVTPAYACGVAAVGTTAYVTIGSGLQVIDASNPASPQIISSVVTPGYACGVTVVGTTAYVADSTYGFQAIDISNPANPQIIGSVDTPGSAGRVKVVDNIAYVAVSKGLVVLPVPTEIKPVTVNNATSISVTLPSPIMIGNYTLRVLNANESNELVGAVSSTDDLQILSSKAIVVAGGGPDAPGEIWEETKLAANKAYDILVHEGYDHDSIWYLSMENGNPFVDGPSLRFALDEAINNWAADASELVIFFVDHGLPDNFINFATSGYSEQLNVDELDDWLDTLQQVMIGPLTFIYDACNSGTFASKLSPPTGKTRIVITGASDEPAYFRGEDSFSYQFWEHILLQEGNLGYAFSGAADVMQGYQSALINANGNSLTNEVEDINIANSHIIRRGQPIYLKPAPTIGNVNDNQTLNGSTSATIWVSDVRDVQKVWAKIIPPDINPDIDGVPITDLPSIELLDPDYDGTYEGNYNGFTTEGTYTIIVNAQTSQEIYSYVQDAMINQIITSSPVFTSVTQMNGVDNISADDYEDDDTYPQANAITLNDLDVQPHSFHDFGDVDWVKFYAISGQTYTIKAYNINVICDVVIELFDSNGITRLVGPWNKAGDGEDEVIGWTCTRDDVYYVKLSNANATFGENCKYDLKLYRPIGPLAGFVNGLVEDAITQLTLADVQIKTDLNQTTLSLSNGSYLMVHPPGSFTITAQKPGYNSKDISGVLINEGGSTALDINLVPIDTDGDGIPDMVETASACLDVNDADTDDDCIPDGVEDANHNGFIDGNETDPCDRDSDEDGIQDGTELGYTLSDAKPDTDPSIFQPDLDPTTTTDPIDDDTDNDGLLDGQEDKNQNGRVDPAETDPNQTYSNSLPWLMLLLFGE